MLTKTLLAGAALAMIVSGAAVANPKIKAGAAAAAPKQPIPYDQLDAYLKASPKQRAAKDWWAGEAATGMQADTSANLPPAPTTGSMSGEANAGMAVNPPAADAPPSMPSTPPADSNPDAMAPQPGADLPGTDPNMPPKEPK
ncbi:MAG: hypothetical protein QM608_07920 [Caulobacter sp.]